MSAAAVGEGVGGVGSASRVPRRDQPWSWHASRASAILLAVLVPVHVAVTLLVDDVGRTTARSTSARLDDPTWRILTWLLVALAVVHATIAGARALRGRRGWFPVAATVAVGVVGGGALAAATWVLTTRWV